MNKTSPSVAIRKAVGGDAEALSALAIRTFTDAFGASNNPADVALYLDTHYRVEAIARDLADVSIVTLLAGDAPFAGFAQLKPSDAGGFDAAGFGVQRPAKLSRLYVDEPWHGRGVAPQLLGALEDAARASECDAMWLTVWEHNARAIAFYSKCGFKVCGKTDFLLGTDPQRDFVMAIRLAT
ncbi:MAG: GNAT family N-acetyltransferase [Pseudomonadota bacterium]